MSKSVLALHGLNVIIGCLCIAILGLTAHCIVVKDRIDALLPSNTKSTGTAMLMWAGCGGIVDMALFFSLAVAKPLRKTASGSMLEITQLDARPRSLRPSQTATAQHTTASRTWLQRIILFVAAFIFVRPLIVLIYTFAESSASTSNVTRSANGHVTPERWACHAGAGREAQSLCHELRAARYLLIPVVVLAAAMPTLLIIYFRKKSPKAEIPEEWAP